MIKILIGGSPCTKWSVAQKKDRETEAEGIGWELFKNYLIAKEKFKPDFFLYENNKSAAQPIKDQISLELGVPLQYINSALVSAQQRQRFYAHNIPNVQQPEDKGILLKDILESGIVDREKSYCLKHQQGNARDYLKKNHAQVAFEPIRIGTISTNSQAHRVYSPFGKSINIIANGGGQGAKTGLYATPIKVASVENGGQGYRIYSVDGKAVSQTATGGGIGSNTGLYAIPTDKKVYEVVEGLITYNGVQYPINLPDGYYIIRKLTPVECERLQTMPDGYTEGISDTQRYKCLGNGWTAEVIIHILKHMHIPLDEEIIVLSMYDGIATGRYCFDKMGYKNIQYHAYEIDKYAMQVAMKNYPNIIQYGDAFQIREDNWKI